MKIIITVILLLVASSIANAQSDKMFLSTPLNDTLIASSDTIVVDTLSKIAPHYSKWYKYIYLVVKDTGTTGTADSVVVEIWDKNKQVWLPVGLTDMLLNVSCTASYRNGVTNMYRLNVNHGDIIRRVLTNSGAGYVANRTVLSWLYLVNTY